MDLQSKVKAIDEWLPQTQCTQCTYPRCRDYAEAIAKGEADINQCPPGGDVTIRGLATVTGKIGKPLNPEYGVHEPKQIAVIDEDLCIGCVMCIKACPTDAIIGAAKQMHTVIEQDCTGCKLCLEPCPVDCIEMIDTNETPQPNWRWDDYSPEKVNRARILTEEKLARTIKREHEKSSSEKLRKLRKSQGSEQIKSEIAAAIQRAKNKNAQN